MTSACTDVRWQSFEVRAKITYIILIYNELVQLLICRSIFVVELPRGIKWYVHQSNVSKVDRPRYRTRKSEVAMNVLDVCDTKRDFVFVLVGWDGSTATRVTYKMQFYDLTI